MQCLRIATVLAAVAIILSGPSRASAQVNLGAVGGFAVSPDNTTLVVSLPDKTELVYFDTVKGKESKRVSVEFAPDKLAWQGKTLFASQKSGGIVHILDAGTGKEIGKATVRATAKSISVGLKGPAFVSNINNDIYAVDTKGMSQKSSNRGMLVAADPQGKHVYYVYEGKVRTSVYKDEVDGLSTRRVGGKEGVVNPNLWGVYVSPDGKTVGVSAGGGFDEGSGKRHYAIPIYDTGDMQTMLGEIAPHARLAYHPVLPLAAAIGAPFPDSYQIINTKTYANISKHEYGKSDFSTILAFVGKGRKVAVGGSSGGSTTLRFFDLTLTKDQEAMLDKAFSK